MAGTSVGAVARLFGGDQVGCEQDAEGIAELGLGAAVLAHEEALEDGLVEPTADLVGRAQVSLVAVGEEGEAGLQRRFDCRELDFGGLEQVLCGLLFAGDSVLLFFEEIEGDGACVVSLEELAALLFEVAGAIGGDCLVAVGVRATRVDFLVEQLFQQFCVLRVDADVAPLLFDVGFDEVDRNRSLCAVGALLVASKTEEVQVGCPVAVGRLGDAEPAAAALTPDRSFQVVVVYALFFAGDVVGGEDLLNPLEEISVDEGGVGAAIFDALPGDFADVVAVAQHPVDARLGERLLGEVGGCAVGEAAIGECVRQPRERPITGCVLLERPAHERCSRLIDLDCADLATALDLADIQVANRCFAKRAAVLRLLHESLRDFAGEVTAVELGDRAHDPVQEHPARGVVDALAARDERRAGPGEGEVDLDVVDSVPGQPVDFVDDHVVDLLFDEEGEHPLQLWSVGGLGALSALDELLDDNGV